MAKKRPPVAQQRLARVRAIKDEFFTQDMTFEERLELRDARIIELERQVAELHERLRAKEIGG